VFAQGGLQPPEPLVETNSSGCMKALMRAGSFLSLVPWHLVAHDVKRGELVVLRVADLQFDRDVVVVRRADSALTPAAQAFLTFLNDRVARLGPMPPSFKA
jgi:DNA-binding transcriptional LysR family regulator